MKRSFKYFVVSLLVVFSVENAIGQDTLETVQFDMGRCVNLYSDVNTRVATTRTELDSIIRSDMSRALCMEKLKDVDMENFSLLGINLNSGYCRVPAGLTFTTVKIVSEKKYILVVNYDVPIGTCRALSSYDLWVKVPSLPDGYTVEFFIEPKERNEKQ